MLSFLMGIENEKWKWQCVHCKEVFYTKIGHAQDAELHECKAAQQSVQSDITPPERTRSDS